MTLIVALGVKNSVGFNNVLNVINLMVWVFMMIAGLFFVNVENWDEGRFLPFGWSGVRRCRGWGWLRLSGPHLPPLHRSR